MGNSDAEKHFRMRVLLCILLAGLGIILADHFFSIPRGLTGRYYNNVAGNGSPLYTVRDKSLTLSRIGNEFPLTNNYSIQWTGVIYAPVAGSYEFTLAARGSSSLRIYNQMIVENQTSDNFWQQHGTIMLAQGFHPISLSYSHQAGEMQLQVYWTRPGTTREIVPANFLFTEEPGSVRCLSDRISTVITWLWIIGLFGVVLLAFLKWIAPSCSLSGVQLDFIFLFLYLLIINLPYFAPSYHFVPAHDSMLIASVFSNIYNEFFINSSFPLWMPYYLYGSPVDVFLLGTMTPAMFFMAFLGKILSVTNSLLLFKLGVLLEQSMFLIGVYLLARRLFTNRATVLFICIGCIAAAGFWPLMISWNFRQYYLIPLVLFFLIKFDDTLNFTYLALVGIATIFPIINSSYTAPVWLFTFLLFTMTLLIKKIKQIFSQVKTILTLSFLGSFLLLIFIAAVYLYTVVHSLDYTVLYSPGRDHLTGKVPLPVFLKYGAAIGLENLLEFFYAIPASSDLTFYIGLIPLIFILYALTRREFDRMLKIFLITSCGILLLSVSYFTFVAPLLYMFFPLFDYFRHIAYVRSFLKILLLFLAGFGIDAFLNSQRRDVSTGLSVIGFGLSIVAGLLLLDIFAFNGHLPYYSYLQQFPAQSRDWFHYFALFVLMIFVLGVYRATKLESGNVQWVLLICFLLEITSYHYFLINISPISLPELPQYQFETSEEYNLHRTLVESSFDVKDYNFQAQRVPFTQALEMINRRTPLLNAYYGEKYPNNYVTACVDPCLPIYRFEFTNAYVDRLFRARLGIPLDTPLAGGSVVPLPVGAPSFYGGQKVNPLSEDKVFLRAIGCHSPKLFLTAQVQIAHNLKESAAIIKESQKIDTIPVIFSEIGRDIPVISRPPHPSEPAGTVQVTHFTANSLSVRSQVTSPGGAWLIYLDAYHPDWTATVNGAVCTIMTANLAFKAVHLQPGLNQVEFTFTGNKLMSFSVRIFYYLGIVSSIVVLGIICYLSIPGIFELVSRKLRRRL